MRSIKLILILLIVTLIFGFYFSVNGLQIFWRNSATPYNNLGSVSTGVVLGWAPQNASEVNPIISMGVLPFLDNNETSDIIFNIFGTIYTHRTFTFGFISPFLIRSLEETNGVGHWSYQNVADLGSVIYYNFALNPSLTGGSLGGSAIFYFSNMPATIDHGTYTIAIPFGAGLTSQFQSAANLTDFPSYATGRKFEFLLDIPLSFAVLDSYPSFSPSVSSPVPVLGPKCCGVQGAYQALPYELNGTSGLFVRYENSTEADIYVTSQSWEFFYFGVGIPLILSSVVEIARSFTDKAQKSASAEK